MGEQIIPTKKVVQFEAERWTFNAETCEDADRDN